MGELIAQADDIVTCENGHPMYRITTEVFRQSQFLSSQFEALHPKIPRPGFGRRPVKCPMCGAQCVKPGPGGRGVSMHFEEGYRS